MNASYSRALSLLRQEKKLSQRQVAKELGVSQALLSHYENGVREPGLDFLVKACEFYEVTTDYLLGRTMVREASPIVSNIAHNTAKRTQPVFDGSTQKGLELLTGSLNILYGLLIKLENEDILNEVTAYFSAAIYKIIRILYRATPAYSADFFSVPENVFLQGADACIKLAEMDVIAIIEQILREKKPIPEISHDMLLNDYPDMFPYLLEVLHRAGEQICMHDKRQKDFLEVIRFDRA